MKVVVVAMASMIVSGFLAVPAVAHADAPPVNLPVTDDVRAQLLQAGATLTGHPASEYTGLEPGTTYYGYDPNSDTYWAAAALSGPKTFDAGVMLQDANSYMMFRESGQGGTWVPFRVGYGPGPSCHQAATAHCHRRYMTSGNGCRAFVSRRAKTTYRWDRGNQHAN